MHIKHQDQILRGALLVFIGVFMIAAMNTVAKLLSGNYHPVELTFYRNLIVFLPLVVFFQFSGKWGFVRTRRMKSHVLRALIGTSGIVCAFWAVSLLPLMDATTILYTAPLFVTALSVPMLNEKVGAPRWIAVIVGFSGVVMITAPQGQNIVFLGVAFALAGALFNALTQIFLRDMGKTEAPLTTVFYFMGFGLLATGLCMPFIHSGTPHYDDLGLLALLGLTGGLQQIIKTKGYALAPVTITSPLNYTGLIWATLFGFLFWGHFPSWMVICGACVIIGSNFFILWREQQIKHGRT